MFGIALANLSSISEDEKARYQALYCGLCLSLKERYGQAARISLSYELTFLAMLYASLYEPVETTGEMHCIAHPKKKMPYTKSGFTDYCADLSVGLAYHKCLDDAADEHAIRGRVSSSALTRAYRKACARLPEHMQVIEEAMSTIRCIELSATASLDETSKAFGEMLGFLIECDPEHFPDIWSGALRDFGFELGRFVLLMDAAVDLESDRRTNSYNPFLKMAPEPDTDEMRVILSDPLYKACRIFERLPLVQDYHLMQSVLYSGVWQKFNQTYKE